MSALGKYLMKYLNFYLINEYSTFQVFPYEDMHGTCTSPSPLPYRTATYFVVILCLFLVVFLFIVFFGLLLVIFQTFLVIICVFFGCFFPFP